MDHNELVLVKKRKLPFVSFSFSIIIYKIALELVYWLSISVNNSGYIFDFSPIKYLNGVFNLVLLYLLIMNKYDKKPSSFFLLFELLIAFVPMTVLYSLANENSIYYNLLSLAFVICIFATKYIRRKYVLKRKYSSNLMINCAILIASALVIHVFIKNGLPNLVALNIYKVYDIRGESLFVINHYFNYIFRITMYSILPFILAVFLYKRAYLKSVFVIIVIMFLYLHQPHKTYLFSIPFLILTNFMLRYDYKKILKSMTLTITGIITLSVLSNIFYLIQRLLVRRVIFDSSIIRYFYFDFFTNNGFIGFGGTLVGKIFGIVSEYGGNLGLVIGELYFHVPTNANASFLVEGFMRFGYLGVFISLFIFALLLRYIDSFSQRIGNKLAIVIWIFPIYILNESLLIDEILTGFVLSHLILTAFYKEKKT